MSEAHIGDSRLPGRFWEKIVLGPDGIHSQTGANLGPCWIWAGHCDRDGYGKWTTGSQSDGTRASVLAYRSAYVALVGEVPDGQELDHLCRAKNCVNPNHLESVSHTENVRRGNVAAVNSVKMAARHAARQASETHCANGHPYALYGMVERPSRPNARCCKLCKSDANRKYRAQRRRGNEL